MDFFKNLRDKVINSYGLYLNTDRCLQLITAIEIHKEANEDTRFIDMQLYYQIIKLLKDDQK